MQYAGVVVVWSGPSPRLAAYRIDQTAGTVFGRAFADASDTGISGSHARFGVENGRILVVDLGSRNGTHVNGRLLRNDSALPRLPAVVRTGMTVSVLVDDVRPFENVTIERRGKLVVARSLANALAQVDNAANDEENLVLLGTTNLGRLLAREYAAKLGDYVEAYLFMPAADRGFAQHVEGKRARTIILVLNRPLTLPDLPELSQWLETDVRIVSIARDMDAFKYMPEEITARLSPRLIHLPGVRYDELPTVILDQVRKRVPAADVHASLVEMCLLRAREIDEDTMFADLEGALDWNQQSPVRGELLVDYIDNRNAIQHVRIGGVRFTSWRDRQF